MIAQDNKKIPEDEILMEFEKYKESGVVSNHLGRIFNHFINLTLLKKNWYRYTSDWKEAFTFTAYKQLNKNFKKFNPDRGKISSWIIMIVNQGFMISIVQLKKREIYDRIVEDQLGVAGEITYQDHEEYDFEKLKMKLKGLLNQIKINFHNNYRSEIYDCFMRNGCDFQKTSKETHIDEQVLLGMFRSILYGIEKRTKPLNLKSTRIT